MAVYLHHDASVFTNVFCSTCLCADSVVSFLSENFVCFGWDLSFQSNRNRYVEYIYWVQFWPRQKNFTSTGINDHNYDFNSNCRAVNMITKHFGSVAASNVKSLEIEKLPLIALIYRLRGTTEIFQVNWNHLSNHAKLIKNSIYNIIVETISYFIQRKLFLYSKHSLELCNFWIDFMLSNKDLIMNDFTQD